MTVIQNDGLVDWVRASGKNLTTIYITHGHRDHWFGIGEPLESFPGARGRIAVGGQHNEGTDAHGQPWAFAHSSEPTLRQLLRLRRDHREMNLQLVANEENQDRAQS